MANNARVKERKEEKERLYQEGYQAFQQGKSVHSNPHRYMNNSMHWSSGWKAAQRHVEVEARSHEDRKSELLEYLLENEDILKRLIDRERT